jgi:hypothetical protein
VIAGGRFTTDAQALAFILAGNARITFVSKKTGDRFTFRVSAATEPGDSRHFVAILRGSDNEADYEYIGTIFNRTTFRHGSRARVSKNAPSVRAFGWSFSALVGGKLPTQLEVWHEGRCGKCGRTLTVPESIETGLGPECSRKIGRAAA